MSPSQNAHERIVRNISGIAGVMQFTFEPSVQPRVMLLIDVLDGNGV